MSTKSILIFIATLILLTVLAWFGLERGILYWETHSPLPKKWMAVHLSDGQIFYGQLAGVGRDVVKISNAYFLDQFNNVADTNPEKAVENANSQSFSVGATAEPAVPKLVLVKKERDVFLNRSAILYWEEVDPGWEAYKYLR